MQFIEGDTLARKAFYEKQIKEDILSVAAELTNLVIPFQPSPGEMNRAKDIYLDQNPLNNANFCRISAERTRKTEQTPSQLIIQFMRSDEGLVEKDFRITFDLQDPHSNDSELILNNIQKFGDKSPGFLRKKEFGLWQVNKNREKLFFLQTAKQCFEELKQLQEGS